MVFVALFKRYHELCPQDAPPDAFYLELQHQLAGFQSTHWGTLLLAKLLLVFASWQASKAT